MTRFPNIGLLLSLLFANITFAQQQQPNFLVIVADDLAWSDLGVFGSEIHTPALNALASRGTTMSHFYVAPTCSPTRAMLLTGVDSHAAGLGTMHGVQAPNQSKSPNYAGQLHDGVVTVAEALRHNGYSTLMTGKWHLGVEEGQYPHQRGFDQSFILLEGGASHFSDGEPLYRGVAATYLEHGLESELPQEFYSSINYTDKLLEYLASVDRDAPFFAYIAYTAPHTPLQVPEDWLERYAGAYMDGPAALRRKRVNRLVEMGLLPTTFNDWQIPQIPAFLPGHIPPWESYSDQERRDASKPMEIYAAMIELMDQQIQRLVDRLAQTNRLSNTYVIFISDNGANGATPLTYPNNTRDWFRHHYDLSGQNQGRKGTHTFLDREWAWATAAPFKLYKGAIAEGGIRAPLIVAGPGVEENARSEQVALVTDVSATIYEAAGIDPITSPAFDSSLLPQGRSLLNNWQATRDVHPRTFSLELFGHRAVVADNWKATSMRPPLGQGDWQLFDLDIDPGETHNLAEAHPDQVQRLTQQYAFYATENGVIAPNPPIKISFGDIFVAECDWGCEIVVQIIDKLAEVFEVFTVQEE